jgi:hypothetical protein
VKPHSGRPTAYEDNRRAAIESVIEADPVAARVRDIMAAQTMWSGNASELLRIGADPAGNGGSPRDPNWPKSPRALAGRLRRAQTALRTLGIEIAFGREGRAGTRIIRMNAPHQHESHETVSIVSTVGPIVAPSNSETADPPADRQPQMCRRC